MSYTAPRIKFPPEEIDFFKGKGVDLEEVRSLFEYFRLLEKHTQTKENDPLWLDSDDQIPTLES